MSNSFALALTLLIAPSLLVAQTPSQSGTATNGGSARSLTATVVTQAPAIDGLLTDAAWASARPLSDFVQRELREGEPVTERTEVRVLSDGEALYVGAWLFDREPHAIVPGEKVRDVTLDNSDSFSFILDTYLDRQNGFVFATTPTGVEYDGQVVKEGEGGGIMVAGVGRALSGSMGGFNLNWDGSWTVATSSDSLGWYAEFRIPYSTLRYGSGTDQTWGVNFSRRIRRKNEEAYWSFIPRQFSLYRLSRAGMMQLSQLPVPRLATVTPYTLGNRSRDYTVAPALQRWDNNGEWGIDAKYGVTPSLTLDLTYNTDFAQVEVDEQRTNLTRFPLFFPEKRPFFLENAGTFSSGTPQAVDLFFTRRIGIDPLGQPVPILGGGRLSGRVGGVTVGALQILTDEVPGTQPLNSYSVARVTREYGSRSRFGLIGVQRLAVDSTSNRNGTYGVDARIGAGEAWTFDLWGASTATPGRDGDAFGYSGRANYATAKWNATLRTIRVGPSFNPEVGFLNRTGGYQFYEASAMRMVRNSSIKWMKQWNPHGSFRGHYRINGGEYTSGQWHIDLTEVEFAKGGRFGPEFNYFHEFLASPFTIASAITRPDGTVQPAVILPAGAYNYPVIGLDAASNPAAPLSITLRGDFGPFYNGTRNGGNATITYRQGASLSTSLLVDYNDVRLDQGKFERELVGARVAYFFTPRIFVQTLTQYSNQAQIWTANARFGWLSTAGTGLFIVFNDAEQATGFFDWTAKQNRSLTIKYARQFGTGS